MSMWRSIFMPFHPQHLWKTTIVAGVVALGIFSTLVVTDPRAVFGNTFTTSFDLTVIGTSGVSVASGGTVSLPASVEDGGNWTDATGSYSDILYVDTDSNHPDSDTSTWGNYPSYYSGPALTGLTHVPPGTAVSIAQSFTAPIVATNTTYYYRYCADTYNQINETNETNNCSAWQTITITAPAISACTPSPASAAPNQPVTWTATVSGMTATNYSWTNGGTPATQNGASASFTTKFSSGGSYAPSVTATGS